MKRTVRIAHRLALVLKSYCIRYIQNRFCSLFLSARAFFCCLSYTRAYSNIKVGNQSARSVEENGILIRSGWLNRRFGATNIK